LFFHLAGVAIQMHIHKETIFREIKEDLWEEAERYPFFGHLKDKSLYVLNTVDPNEIAISDELMLHEIKPMFCLFKVTERMVSVNNLLNKNISTLIGKTLSDFKTIKSAEVSNRARATGCAVRLKSPISLNRCSSTGQRLSLQNEHNG
jgi:phosphatidylinositol-4,5-bisphosphate 3-kinase catalytic subunit alpha/beta/delta